MEPAYVVMPLAAPNPNLDTTSNSTAVDRRLCPDEYGTLYETEY